jgi:hypothetical protein
MLPVPWYAQTGAEADIRPWIREYYADGRLAELIAQHRARVAQYVAAEERDESCRAEDGVL